MSLPPAICLVGEVGSWDLAPAPDGWVMGVAQFFFFSRYDVRMVSLKAEGRLAGGLLPSLAPPDAAWRVASFGERPPCMLTDSAGPSRSLSRGELLKQG